MLLRLELTLWTLISDNFQIATVEMCAACQGGVFLFSGPGPGEDISDRSVCSHYFPTETSLASCQYSCFYRDYTFDDEVSELD